MGLDDTDFSAIPDGHIMMRDARTGGSRDVQLRPFTIGVTTVRFADFAGTTDATPADKSPDAPAHTVTWNIEADGYRLPTEAEWEFACRAGTDSPTYGPLGEIAWTAADGVEGPQAVGGKLPNTFGLYDTIGNVWEWCWDYADTARYGEYRALRGGGWADQAWSCRASVRRGSAPDAVLEDVGFRVARGAVGERGALEAQGWSAEADRERADIRGPLPIGWTPLRSLLG